MAELNSSKQCFAVVVAEHAEIKEVEKAEIEQA